MTSVQTEEYPGYGGLKENSTIKRCGLIEVGVVLLEKVCLSLLLLPSDPDVKLPATPSAPCLPTKPPNYKSAQIKCVCVCVCV